MCIQQIQNNQKHFSDIILKPNHTHLALAARCDKSAAWSDWFMLQGVKCKLLHCYTDE